MANRGPRDLASPGTFILIYAGVPAAVYLTLFAVWRLVS